MMSSGQRGSRRQVAGGRWLLGHYPLSTDHYPLTTSPQPLRYHFNPKPSPPAERPRPPFSGLDGFFAGTPLMSVLAYLGLLSVVSGLFGGRPAARDWERLAAVWFVGLAGALSLLSYRPLRYMVLLTPSTALLATASRCSASWLVQWLAHFSPSLLNSLTQLALQLRTLNGAPFLATTQTLQTLRSRVKRLYQAIQNLTHGGIVALFCPAWRMAVRGERIG